MFPYNNRLNMMRNLNINLDISNVNNILTLHLLQWKIPKCIYLANVLFILILHR